MFRCVGFGEDDRVCHFAVGFAFDDPLGSVRIDDDEVRLVFMLDSTLETGNA